MTITPEQLTHASAILREVLSFEYPADAVLSHYFRNNKSLGMRDRAFLAESVYAVLRVLRGIYAIGGEQLSPRQVFLLWLNHFAGRSLQQLETLVSRGEVQWLGSFPLKQPPLSLAQRLNLPDWLLEKLLQQMDEAALVQLMEQLNASAPLDLRVNPLKAEREKVLAQLNREGLVCRAGDYSPLAIRMKDKPALQRHKFFLDGTIEVQDEGSQLLGFLTGPKRGEMVADFCAGAGGKTLLLGALMRNSGRLYAFDIAEKRLAKLKPRLARSGLSNVHPVLIAHENDSKVKRLAGKLDRVLVDAPCSGLGTLRRNPDLSWRQSAESVTELTAKQAQILASAARLVKPGGRLVYATCSLLQEENDAIVERFLAEHAEFSSLSAAEIMQQNKIALDTGERLRLTPHEHGTDGFFAVAMQRSS